MNKLSLFFLALLLNCVFSLLAATNTKAAELSFSTEKKSIPVGQTVTLPILMNAIEQVVGVDLYVRYDPSVISIVSLTKTNSFSMKSGERIENSKGYFRASFSNSVGIYTTGRVTVADVVLRVLKETAQSELYFVYNNNDTTDTNVAVSGGRDALSKVQNISFSTTTDITPSSFSTTGAPTTSPQLDKAMTEQVRGTSDEFFLPPTGVATDSAFTQDTLPTYKVTDETRERTTNNLLLLCVFSSLGTLAVFGYLIYDRSKHSQKAN